MTYAPAVDNSAVQVTGGPLRRRVSLFAATALLALPATAHAAGVIADAGYCDSTAVANAWTGTGRTIAVLPGQSIQAAVDSAVAGDTVELADGNYGAQSVSVTKAIRLRAAHKFGAVLQNGSEPSSANASGSGTAISVHNGGMVIDGLELRYYATGIDVDNGGPLTIQNNRVVSPSSAGIQIYDARQPRVQCNSILDPYLPNDPNSQSPATPPNISDAQADYGVNFYGTTDPVATHNYFRGIFNQALSFKEANRNPTASFNTFEGSKLTALFFGQNGPHNGPYEYAGLPTGADFGTLTADSNVFREARDSRGVYYLRSPIRVWHVNGNVVLKNNVVESSEQGFLIECKASSDGGCAQGSVSMTDNTVGGAVDNGGTRVQVNRTGCVLAWTGITPPRVTASMTNTTCVSTPQTLWVGSDGFSGGPTVSQSGTRVASSPVSSLRTASEQFDPDIEFAAAAPPSPFVSDTFTETTGTHRDAHVGETGATWTEHPPSLR